MTPDEYEWQDEQMQDIADQARDQHQKSGRDVREILQAMRDDGRIQCGDATLDRCVVMATEQRIARG